MNPSTPPRDDDVTGGWPDDPRADELAGLGRSLRRNRPGLSPDAMARVRREMRRELDAAAPTRRLPLRPWLLRAAAAVLLAAGAWLAYRAFSPAPSPPPVAIPPANLHVPPPDGDSYLVRLAPVPSRAPARPLLPLEEYRPLFGDLPPAAQVGMADAAGPGGNRDRTGTKRSE